MIFEEEAHLTPKFLPARIVHPKTLTRLPGNGTNFDPSVRASLRDVERDLIVQALSEARWNQTRAAILLGVTRDTLRYKMKKYRLARPAEKNAPLDPQNGDSSHD